MKYIPLLLTTILSTMLSTAFAQTASEIAAKQKTDSLKLAGLSEYATRYPALRQGAFATDIMGNGNVKAELNGKDLYEGKLKVTRIRSNFNIPVVQWGRNVITGTISYQQTHFETDQIKSYSPEFSSMDRSLTKSTVGFTASFSRIDSIFHHAIRYSAGISGLTDEASSIKRVNYIGNVTVPVMRSQYSSLSLGVVVLLDPSSISPVIPIVSYWHKFKTPDLYLYVDLPQRIVVRKQLSKKSWAFVGSELGGNFFFFDFNQPSLPHNSIYSTVDIRTGGTFEYLLTKKLVIGVSGGLYTTAQSRMYADDAKSSAYFFKSQNGSVPYISFSISFLPFLKSITNR
ncbi:MAG: hypothetical protein JWR38_1143 [Mucilaginibacter sp.]|nr:hypothetical protein [Mucilaginibacter sp.]